MRLGAVGQAAQAELDGFKSRALRAAPPTQRHLYVTEWRTMDSVGAASAASAASTVSAANLVLVGAAPPVVGSVGAHVGSAPLMVTPVTGASTVVATQRAQLALLGLVTLEVSLGTAQTQATGARSAVWLLVAGAGASALDVQLVCAPWQMHACNRH